MRLTVEDARELSKIIGSAELTPETLARELIRHYRMHRKALERYTTVVAERNDLRTRLSSARSAATRAKNSTPTVRELRRENERQARMIEILLRRNQILAAKTGKFATEPAA